jgi:hypothetical protein
MLLSWLFNVAQIRETLLSLDEALHQLLTDVSLHSSRVKSGNYEH